MTKNVKRFFSMLLALSMVFSLALPAAATETEEHTHEHAEEAVQETVAVETTEETTAAAEVIVNVSSEPIEVDLSEVKLDLKISPVTLMTDGVEVDTSNPIIMTLEAELKNVLVLDEETQQPVPLTAEEQAEILKMYQQYLDHWAMNANVLGVQTPFFLSYNDNGEDGLGIMGEMLVMAGATVDAVRYGYMTYDDLSGMILNFMMGDMMGVQLYGETIKAKRDEVLALVNAGDYTEAQKMLIINDWLAHNATFDMSYIMNADKEEGEMPMVAENPQKHPYYDVVYDAIYDIYEPQIVDTFEQNIIDGLMAQMSLNIYQQAIHSIIYDATIAEIKASEDVKTAATSAVYDEAYETAYEAKETEIWNEEYAAAKEKYQQEQEEVCEHSATDLKASFTWTDLTATADIVCGKCGETVAADQAATVTEDAEAAVAATCGTDGKQVYVASVVYNEVTYTDTKDVTIPATGEHVYDAETGKCVCGAEKPADEGTTDEGTTDEGTTDEGTTDEGTTDEGTTDEGTTDEGTTDEGTTDEGTTDEGTTDENTTDESTTDEGAEEASGENAEQTPVVASIEADIGEISVNLASEAPVLMAAMTEEEIEAAAKADADKAVNETRKAEIEEYADAEAQKAVEALTEDEVNAKIDALVEADEDTVTAYEQQATEQADAYLEQNKDAIAEDPYGFISTNFGADAADQIKAQADGFVADCKENDRVPGMVAQIKLTAYQSAIKQTLMEQMGYSEADADAYLEANADAIAADPYAFVESQWGTDAAQGMEAGINDELTNMGIDPSTETNPNGYVALSLIVAMQMDTPQQDEMLRKYNDDGTPAVDENGNPVYMTPNEAVPVFAGQAAAGLTEGVLDYWEGSHIGILGDGTGVCLGYTKAFTYLVQSMHPEVYLVEGATALDSDYEVTLEDGSTQKIPGANWKSPEDLYYNADGNLDITLDYIVDTVRISFDASVTMYGQTEDNFNSDHFWNAVKIPGADGNMEWFYVDPCYTDVYGEVMMRDRVETDGAMNHLYFLFSDAAARELYDGNYKELKSLYVEVTKDEAGYDTGVTTDNTSAYYEDGWFAYAKSNVYIADGYAYYLYDTTDMLDLMDQFENSNMNDLDIAKLMSGEFKIVKHDLSAADNENAVTPLVEFNVEKEVTTETTDPTDPTESTDPTETTESTDPTESTDAATAAEEGETTDPTESTDPTEGTEETETETVNVAQVRDASGNMVESELLTKLFEKHEAEEKIYPGLNLTCALYGNKIYFNLSNCILSYNLSDGSVVIEKKYETITGYRDTRVPFGGMAFSTTANDYADDVSFTVYNRPLSGLTIKGSTMYASVATNFAFISGKDPTNSADQSSYGYEFEESNYNPNYSTYTASQNSEEVNDNDEFMWSANFVDTFDVSSLSGGTTEYDFTECEHHFVRFDETFYTTNSETGEFNTGYCYVCTECNFAIDEPVQNDYAGQMGIEDTYEEEKAIFDAAEANYGHTYEATNGVYNPETGTIDFTHLKCSAICPQRYGKVDCLLTDNGERDYEGSVAAEVSGTEGSCDTGLIANYTGSTVINEGTEEEPKNLKIKASAQVTGDPGQHAYEVKEGDSEWGFVMNEETGEATDQRKAEATITCAACSAVKIEGVVAVEITADAENTSAPTCTEAGADAYIATYTIELDDGSTVNVTERRSFTVPATGHTIVEVAAKAATCTEDGNTAHFACENGCGMKFSDAEGATAIEASSVVLAATGHSLSLVEAKAATCTEDGNKAHYACANGCGMVFEDEAGETGTTLEDVTLPKLGHTMTKTEAKEASCTEAGNNAYYTCGTCNLVFKDEAGETETTVEAETIAVKDHVYSEPTFAWSTDYATCTASYTCSVGGETETAECDVTSTTEDASCTEAGTITYTATIEVAGQTYTDIKEVEGQALGHDYKVEFTWANDYSMATATIACSRCDDSETQVCDIQTEVVDATCTAPGKTIYTATVTLMGQQYTDVKETPIAQLDHTPADPVREKVVDATCTEEGSYEEVIYCSVCRTELSREAKTSPKISHTSESIPGKDPTCTETGLSTGLKCSVCGTITGEQTVIPALGHTEETIPGKAATCTETGLTDGVKCSVCGVILEEQEVIPMVEHTWDDGVVTKEPTNKETGVLTYTCTVCGETKTEEIPMIDPVSRVYGDDRYGTAFAIADTMKEVMGIEQFQAVVISNSENFPDALAGSYLAAMADAPILLTKDKASRLNPVKEYISENLVSGGKVYILGSEAVVPASLENDLTNAGYDVERLAGADRYETNLAVLRVAMELDPDKTKPILVSTGRAFADSLSVSASGLPLLLVRGDKTLTDTQKAFLEENADRARYVIGSNGVVSDSMYEAVGATKRIAGADRYETSVAVANELVSNAGSVVLAYASDFPDGLCGGPLAYQMGASLILTKVKHEDVAGAYVSENGIPGGYVLGSASLVNDDLVRTIFSLEDTAAIPAIKHN